MPMADVCHRYLHARRSWPPGSGQLLLEDDLCSTSSTQPEQHQQGCLAAERDVFRVWHPQSLSLWQCPTICECPVCQLLYMLGHITWNLKSALPTIQWICWGMHQVHQTCTPKSQIQWCWSTACLASTPSYNHRHQASISSRAIVPMLTQNNHSSQDMQQLPICHTSLWADWHTHTEAARSQADKCRKILAPLYAGQPVAMYDTLQKIWGSCYCDMHPTTEQLSSMCQQWFHILLHVETPPWMQCQNSQQYPKWHNCHTAGSNQTPLLSSTTCITPTCTTHAAHIHCTCNTGNPDETGSSCSCHASCSTECPGTNACNIPCHTCAAMKIQLCPHGTKMPDPGYLGTIDLDCPWTLLLQQAAVYIPSPIIIDLNHRVS